MAAVLKLVDEQFGATENRRQSAGELRLISQQVTARDIITQRVAAEVALLNQARTAPWPTRSLLVAAEPGSPETLLNRAIPRPKRALIDVATATACALAAFQQRRFLLLVDDRELEGLDDVAGVGETSEVLFLHLSPLRGG
jgi:hypothetical protein